MRTPVSVYRIFHREPGAAPAVRTVVLAFVLAAAALVGVCLLHISRRHDVTRQGYELSRRTDLVRRLQETRRELELERAALTAPARIARLATALGMEPVAPDKIRQVAP